MTWKAALCALLAAAAVTATSSIALAAWSARGTGPAAGAAATMPSGAAPTGTATGNSVSIRWPAVAMSNGVPVAGYVISRFNALNGAAATVGAGCSGVVTATVCTEFAVPSGTWIYTVTPVQLSWTGSASPPSSAITVP
jgi:hypothetical protein